MANRPPSRLAVVVDSAAALYAAALVAWANATFMFPRAALLQHWDEGYELAFARRMLEGGRNLPYVDAVSHRGPLFYWIVALAVRVSGFGTWMPMRVLALVAMLLTVGLWFTAARMARQSLAGAVMALAYFTVSVVGMHVPWEGPAGWGLSFNSEHLVNVFVGSALLAMTVAFPRGRPVARLPLVFLAGICVMLAGLCKQIGLLAGLPIGLWALAVAVSRVDLPKRARIGIAIAFAVGLFLPLASVVARYAVAGELHTLYYYAVTYNTRIYIPAIDAGNRNYYLHTMFNLHHEVLLAGACLVGWSISRVFASANASFFGRERFPRLEEIARAYAANAFEVTVALGFVLSLVGASLGFRDFGHYYLPIVPWGSLLVGLLVARAIRGVRRETSGRPAQVLMVRASVVLPLAVFATLGWLQRTKDYAASADVQGLFATQDWPICKFLRAHTRAIDSIFIWGFDPAPYTACNRRAASRFVFTTFVSGVVPPLAGGIEPRRSTDASQVVPGAEAQLLEDLRREQPAYIFDSYETLRGRSMLDVEPLRTFLLSDYCRDLEAGPDVWMRRPALGCAANLRPLVSLSSGGREGYLFDRPQPGTAPLKLYQRPRGGEALTTASATVERDALTEGYELVRIEGYVFTSPEAGTVPLKLLYNAARGDHLTTASKEEEAAALRSGYEFVRIEGYVTRS